MGRDRQQSPQWEKEGVREGKRAVAQGDTLKQPLLMMSNRSLYCYAHRGNQRHCIDPLHSDKAIGNAWILNE